MSIDRISVEVTNRCNKACSFCYNRSGPEGTTSWTADGLVSFVTDCQRRGVRAVSFGGGEPLLFRGIFDVLARLGGRLFRSLTTNGLPLLDKAVSRRLTAAAPDKVHVSLHHPEDDDEVGRVIEQVHELSARGIRSGLNFLVGKSTLDDAIEATGKIHRSGIDNERITFLPMRGEKDDTPTPEELARVAGGPKFQAPSCLLGCGRSARFCSITYDQTASWCSYTSAGRPLPSLSMNGLRAALGGLPLKPCTATLPATPFRAENNR